MLIGTRLSPHSFSWRIIVERLTSRDLRISVQQKGREWVHEREKKETTLRASAKRRGQRRHWRQ